MYTLSEELTDEDIRQEIERIFRNLAEKFASPDSNEADKLLRKLILNSIYPTIHANVANCFLDTATAVTELGRQILRKTLNEIDWEIKFDSIHVEPHRLTEMYKGF